MRKLACCYWLLTRALRRHCNQIKQPVFVVCLFVVRFLHFFVVVISRFCLNSVCWIEEDDERDFFWRRRRRRGEWLHFRIRVVEDDLCFRWRDQYRYRQRSSAAPPWTARHQQHNSSASSITFSHNTPNSLAVEVCRETLCCLTELQSF